MQPSVIAIFILVITLVIFLFSSFRMIVGNQFGYIGCAFCIYHIVFFILPSIIHTAYNTFPFYNMSYDEGIQEQTALIVWIFSLSVLSGFFILKPYGLQSKGCYTFEVSTRKIIISICWLVFFQFLVLIIYGINPFLVSRSEFSLSEFSDNSSNSALIVGFSRSCSFISVLLICYFKNELGRLRFILAALCVLPLFFIVNFPLALPRYVFFSYALAILYLFTNSTVKNKFNFFMMFILGVVTIFPLSSFLTRGTESEFNLNVIDYYKTSGDFDGYQSTLNVVQYTIDDFYTLGHQLLSAIFIFIPRFIWDGKASPTGQIAAEHAGYPYTNISSPLVSELFIDFGYVGVTFLAFLLGGILRWLDSYSIISKEIDNHVGIVMSAIIFSFSFILLRGALISVIGNVEIELFIALILMKYIASIKINEQDS